VAKFQGNLARLQQVSSPNSQDTFQTRCADKYLVRFPTNFADLLKIRQRAKYQKPWASKPCLHLMIVVIFVEHLLYVVMEVGARNQSNILTRNQHYQLCCRLNVEVLLMKKGPF